MIRKQNNRSFSLTEIAEWHNLGIVELPKVQRGFVWKPYQIEDLWDSLLRLYPIGSFVLFPKPEGRFELLDGQQRATAICLGFGKETFRETEEKIKVFIDLERPSLDDSTKKYSIRVITKSHPWGYLKVDNKKTLDMDMRRKAMNIYGVDEYNDPNLEKFFPYDCSLAIPLNILLSEAVKNSSNNELKLKVKRWPLWDKSLENWFDWVKNNPTKTDHLEAKELSDEYKIDERIIEVYNVIKKMLVYHSIPSLSLDLEELFKSSESNINNQSQRETDNEEDISNNEIENLFLRLNAGGTPLRGEELNYSILKAHISKDLQKEIEEASVGFSQPSKFITLAYRLFQHKKKKDLRDGLNMKIKPKQFQRTIHEDIEDFETFLSDLINNKQFDGLTLLQYVNHILEYNHEINDIRLPHLIKAKIADRSPEVMFLFLFRIYFQSDRFELFSISHKNALGIITLFMWLGKGERSRDYSKLLRNVWPAATTLNVELFWSSTIVKRAMLNNVLPAIPYYNKKNDTKRLIKIRNYKYRKDTNILYKYDLETNFGAFVYTMFFNRDLILYAQRDFLSKIFSQHELYLDDTNLPFDWDHISPKKFTLKHGVPSIIKEYWYDSIGNFRAWPYALNRSDQDVIPARKFSPINEQWKDDDNILEFEQDRIRWSEFVAKNNQLINSIDDLDEMLLNWSFCNPNWSSIEVDDLRIGWPSVYESIRDRSLEIIGKWYENFNIEKLIPAKETLIKDLFKNELDLRKWELNPKWIKFHPASFDVEEDFNWVLKKPINYKGSLIHLFLLYSKDENKLLLEDKVSFGLINSEEDTFVSKIKITESQQVEYYSDNKLYIAGNTTLISTLPVSKQLVLKSFRNWLDNEIFKDLRNTITFAFDTSLRNITLKKIIE